ncbi:hypothetical protein [Bradyrhizobium sp. USDA 10063]
MTKIKTAIPLDGTPSIVLLDNGDRMKRDKAIAAGYKIVDAAAVQSAEAANVSVDAYGSWRTAITCLPEARERQAAAAELIANRNHQNLTIDQARAFLRGLPVETEQSDTTEENTMNTNDPRAVRLAEISNSMAAYNRNNGYNVKAPQVSASDVEPGKLKRLAEIRLGAMDASGRGTSQEARSLRLALNTHETVGTPLSRLFAQLGVDTSKFLSSNV